MEQTDTTHNFCQPDESPKTEDKKEPIVWQMDLISHNSPDPANVLNRGWKVSQVSTKGLLEMKDNIYDERLSSLITIVVHSCSRMFQIQNTTGPYSRAYHDTLSLYIKNTIKGQVTSKFNLQYILDYQYITCVPILESNALF